MPDAEKTVERLLEIQGGDVRGLPVLEPERLAGHFLDRTTSSSLPSAPFELAMFLKEAAAHVKKTETPVRTQGCGLGLSGIPGQGPFAAPRWHGLARFIHDPAHCPDQETREALLLTYLEKTGLTQGPCRLYTLLLLFASLPGTDARTAERRRLLDLLEETIQLGRFPDSCFLYVFALKKTEQGGAKHETKSI